MPTVVYDPEQDELSLHPADSAGRGDAARAGFVRIGASDASLAAVWCPEACDFSLEVAGRIGFANPAADLPEFKAWADPWQRREVWAAAARANTAIPEGSLREPAVARWTTIRSLERCLRREMASEKKLLASLDATVALSPEACGDALLPLRSYAAKADVLAAGGRWPESTSAWQLVSTLLAGGFLTFEQAKILAANTWRSGIKYSARVQLHLRLRLVYEREMLRVPVTH